MLYQKFCLSNHFSGLVERGSKATLTVYIREKVYGNSIEKKRPCVLICPGGAYSYICEREAEPVALRLIGAGINAAVCRYSIAEDGAQWPDQLAEVSAALALLRRNADEWGCDPDKLVVMGFSAGGHVAGSLGVYWNDPIIAEKLGICYGENRPNGMVLCYPVITAGKFAHGNSIRNLLGTNYSEELLKRVSLEKNVSQDTPRAFLWHTREDGTVPYQNSELMAEALREQGIPCELLILEEGVHGLALADETTAGRSEHIQPKAAVWIEHFLEWIEQI